MPIGILGTLVICTILYILVSAAMTGMVSYKTLNVADPMAVAIDVTGIAWGSILVKVGAVFGLATVMLVMLLAQSRIFFSMSRDGLLWKWAGKIHPRFRTPYISNIVVGVIVAFLPALLPIDKLAELVNMGTLLAFAIVCAGVWILRRRMPDLPRPFKTPWVPLVPICGIVTALYLVWTLPALTKEVVIAWLLVGLLIYFTYSVKHSKVQKALGHGTQVSRMAHTYSVGPVGRVACCLCRIPCMTDTALTAPAADHDRLSLQQGVRTALAAALAYWITRQASFARRLLGRYQRHRGDAVGSRSHGDGFARPPRRNRNGCRGGLADRLGLAPLPACVCGLAVLVVMMLCTALNYKNAGRLGGVTVAIIVLIPYSGPLWHIALQRFLEVSFGIVISLLVAVGWTRVGNWMHRKQT